MSLPPPPPPEIRCWSLILTWPLAVRHGDEVADLEGIAKAMNPLSSRWERVAKPLNHLRPFGAGASPPDPVEYSEYLYFYPFIRRFLFDGDGRAMQLFRRKGPNSVTVTVGAPVADPFSATLRVDRVNLYAFLTGDCVLAVEFSLDGLSLDGSPAMVTAEDGTERPLTLADVLSLNARLRRAYPPFFAKGAAGYGLGEVRWDGSTETVKPLGFDQAAKLVKDGKVPMAGHWPLLLPDLGGSGMEFTQVMDDRIPAMTYVSPADPSALSRADFIRLAAVDEGPGDGNHNALPYGADFLADFERRHCHDRFWDPPRFTCRYLCSGGGFAMVDHGGGAEHRRQHFRRHYFQMALLTQFHLAALQSMSNRLSRAMSSRRRDGEAHKVLDRLLDFTHTYWFPDISNQSLARDLYRLWRGHLGVEALHAQVTAEAAQANAVLDRKSDRDAADSAATLNRLGAFGLGAALATGFLGMNILVPGEGGPKGWNNVEGWLQFGLALAGSWAVLALALWCLGRFTKRGK